MRGAAGAGDDHLEPRASAPAAYSAISLGRAVRRDDAALVRHAEARQRLSSAWRIVSQSDLLPMMMPTSGVGPALAVDVIASVAQDSPTRTDSAPAGICFGASPLNPAATCMRSNSR